MDTGEAHPVESAAMSPDARAAGPRRFDRGRLAVVLALVAAPFVAFPPDFVPKALLDGGDDLLANIPGLIYSARKLLEGEVLWTPSLWMGQPLLAEPEFATFYPPKLLLLLGPPVVAYAAYVLLHYLAAELGAYLYMKSLGIGRTGAVFGALTYAYAGFMVGHRGHTMYVCAGAWTPFVLLSFDRAAESSRRGIHLLAAIAFAMVPLCGAVQLTVYLTGTLLLLAVLRSWFERRWAPLLETALCLGPGLLIAAAQLLPSWDLTHQLATDTRAVRQIQLKHSFHPLLFPTMLLPLPPVDVELYSRVGVVALCAVVVAVSKLRSAPARVRAWAVVFVVATVMMLGRYAPPVTMIANQLPVVGLLRGPARHNFELGLSASVLSAYGVDVALRRAPSGVIRWLVVGTLLLAICWGVVRFGAAGWVSDPDAMAVLQDVHATSFLGAALAFALWLGALATRTASARRILWGAIAVVPALETAWALQLEGEPRRSAIGLFEAAGAVLPKGSSARILSVSSRYGSVDALVGNSVLLLPGVESLQGYSSIAYDEPRELLELDMHGQPVFYDELSFSTLPSVFGVTHLALPSIACGDERFSMVRGRDLCERTSASTASIPSGTPPSVMPGELGCTALATHETFSYRIEMQARGAPTDLLDVTVGVHSRSGDFLAPATENGRLGADLPGAEPGPRSPRAIKSFRLADSESWAYLWMRNRRSDPVEVSSAGLFADRDATVATLGPLDRANLLADRAQVSPDAFRLVPAGETAFVERRFEWPEGGRPADGIAVLEAELRAPLAASRDLVVSLRSGGDALPDAELTVRGAELGADFRVFRRQIRIDGAPKELSLRAVASGGGAIELREVRLARTSDELVYGCPIAMNRYPAHARIDGQRIILGGNVRLVDRVLMPIRVFDVVLDARPGADFQGPVHFGLTAPTRYDQPREWTLQPRDLAGHVRVHHVSVLPPDVRDPRLFVRVDGSVPLRVDELSATDACALRGYRNPRRLANGLFLYENPHALPRAYTVGRTVLASDRRAVKPLLLDLTPSELGNVAVVGAEMPPGLQRGSIVRADFGQRTNDVIVRSDEGPTLLVINERFAPGWRATIDESETTILLVNALVRGIVVPAGTHRVHLEYRAPRAVWMGLALSMAGVLAALVIAPVIARRQRRQ